MTLRIARACISLEIFIFCSLDFKLIHQHAQLLSSLGQAVNGNNLLLGIVVNICGTAGNQMGRFINMLHHTALFFSGCCHLMVTAADFSKLMLNLTQRLHRQLAGALEDDGVGVHGVTFPLAWDSAPCALDLRPTSTCACSGMGLGASSMWVKPACAISSDSACGVRSRPLPMAIR